MRSSLQQVNALHLLSVVAFLDVLQELCDVALLGELANKLELVVDLHASLAVVVRRVLGVLRSALSVAQNF